MQSLSPSPSLSCDHSSESHPYWAWSQSPLMGVPPFPSLGQERQPEVNKDPGPRNADVKSPLLMKYGVASDSLNLSVPRFLCLHNGMLSCPAGLMGLIWGPFGLMLSVILSPYK